MFDKENPQPQRLEGSALEGVIQLLCQEIGHAVQIIGIVEVGAFSREEIPAGRSYDLRVYAWSSKCYFWNEYDPHPPITAFRWQRESIGELIGITFASLPVVSFCWDDFNELVCKKILQKFGVSIVFSVVDVRLVDAEIFHIQNKVASEHYYLLRSQVLSDPHHWISEKRFWIDAKIFTPMTDYYFKTYLKPAENGKYEFETDLCSLLDLMRCNHTLVRKSFWARRAVEVLRDAAMAYHYIQSGRMIYKMNDVLNFYEVCLPEKYDFVLFMYSFVTDASYQGVYRASFTMHPCEMIEYLHSHISTIRRVVNALRKKTTNRL